MPSLQGAMRKRNARMRLPRHSSDSQTPRQTDRARTHAATHARNEGKGGGGGEGAATTAI